MPLTGSKEALALSYKVETNQISNTQSRFEQRSRKIPLCNVHIFSEILINHEKPGNCQPPIRSRRAKRVDLRKDSRCIGGQRRISNSCKASPTIARSLQIGFLLRNIATTRRAATLTQSVKLDKNYALLTTTSATQYGARQIRGCESDSDYIKLIPTIPTLTIHPNC